MIIGPREAFNAREKEDSAQYDQTKMAGRSTRKDQSLGPAPRASAQVESVLALTMIPAWL
jgi:hypothetical protein